jgi:HNH endonuclease
MRERKPLLERFQAKYRVNEETGCWDWLGSKYLNGYGSFRRGGPGGGQQAPAHRIAYELFKGPIPDGLTIDHACRNRGCVNPAHLEAMPIRENTLRGIGPTAQNARKTRCDRGHPLEGENLRVNCRGDRVCVACARDRERLRSRARRERGEIPTWGAWR